MAMKSVLLLCLLCSAAAIPSAPTLAPGDYRIRRRDPPNCDPEDCDYFVGINTNENNATYLDFYLTGVISGWVAVGFSRTANMFDADVVGCNLDASTETVFAVDTYNPVPIRTNNRDNDDTDFVMHSSSFEGGRITCVFSRRIIGVSEAPMDQPLNRDYYLLFGLGATGGGASSFPNHMERIPLITDERLDPSTDGVDIGGAANAPAGVTAPSLAPGDYRIRRRDPPNCDPEDCDYFVGINTNENNAEYLDFYLTGVISGWVAVGFSRTANMFDADVVGCNLDGSTETVFAVDTYNPESRTNIRDIDDSDFVMHSSSFEGGRITCVFSRRIIGASNEPIDQPLDRDYYLLFGLGATGGGASSFPNHMERIPLITDERLDPSTDGVDIGGAANAPAGVTAPILAPADYRLRRRDPEDCDPEDCDYFMGINTNRNNTDFLDFYLTGVISGWVAVGFSRSANMLDADVVGCNLDGSTEMVFAVDTYNPESRTNIRDLDTSDVIMHNSSFEGGRITCIFSRRIIGATDDPIDQPLDRDYYFLFGLGETGGGASSFPDHTRDNIPVISDGRFDPSTDEGDIGITRLRQQLLQAHGILMLIAWPVLAFTAIFFAVYMKQALPNGEWFQVHRAFHIAALFVAVIGFILAFVANKNGDPRGLINLGSTNKVGTAHFVLGIIIMALQIANPIISIFRCRPKGEHRWIFNLIHGSMIGLGVEFLAYANIGIGVSIFSETESDFGDLTIFWVYLAFVVAAIILNSVLLLYFTCEAATKGEEGTKLAPAVVKPFFSKIFGDSSKSAPPAVEMTKAGEPAPHGPPPRKTPASDSPIRWIGLGLFLGLMIPLILAVIVMIADTGSQD